MMCSHGPVESIKWHWDCQNKVFLPTKSTNFRCFICKMIYLGEMCYMQPDDTPEFCRSPQMRSCQLSRMQRGSNKLRILEPHPVPPRPRKRRTASKISSFP